MSTLGIWVIVLVTAIDNALLAGVLISKMSGPNKRKTIIVIGILLALAQIVCSASVDYLMRHLVFQFISIAILAWMSVRLLCIDSMRSSISWPDTIRLFFFTLVGNLDNVIWLGSVLKGDRLWLVLASIISVPIFVMTASFLSDQAEKQTWIIPVGSGMMAWAAASLTIDIPQIERWIGTLDDAPRSTIQCLITAAILLAGFSIRQFLRYRRSSW